LASYGGVVVVTINYRLGVLGKSANGIDAGCFYYRHQAVIGRPHLTPVMSRILNVSISLWECWLPFSSETFVFPSAIQKRKDLNM
jgi:hypothetical protein